MQTEIKPNIKLHIKYPLKSGLYRRYIKRPMDFILSICAIIILSPILFMIAILVRTKLGSPVIFKQKRPGLNEKIFTLYKFRTMTDKRDEKGELLPDEIRLTKFGKILRSTSLDELLEFINILKGDMSFIGPRPLAVQYLSYYKEMEKHRHDVRPGLSGLAQINGRNSLTWEQRFSYDIMYVKDLGFLNDVKIGMKTIIKVFKHTDIGIRGVEGLIDFDVYRENENKNEVINV